MKIRSNTATLINPMQPHEFNACVRWYTYSLVLIGCLMTALGVYTAYWYWQMTVLKTHYTALHPVCTVDEPNLIEHKQQRIDLEHKLQEITALTAKKAVFLKDFDMLIKTLPADICITTIEYAREAISELHGQALSFSSLTHFLQELQKHSSTTALHLVSLHPVTMASGHVCIHFLLQKT